MTGATPPPSNAPPPTPHPGVLRLIVVSSGEWVLTTWHYLCYLLGLTLAVLWMAVRPRSWSSRVRHDFYLQCYFTGNQALGLVLVVAVMFSFGLAQLMQLFKDIGSPIAGSEFVWNLLVRDLGPGLIGLVILGRSGTAITAELSVLKITGQIKLNDEDRSPLACLVLPRVMAMSLMTVILGTIFLIAIVGSLQIQNVATGHPLAPLDHTIDGMIAPLTYREAVQYPLKTGFTGLVGGIICCVEGLRVSASVRDIPRRVARAFAFSVVVTAVVQVVIAFCMR